MRHHYPHVRPLIGCVLASIGVFACSAEPTSDDEFTGASQQTLSATKCPDAVPAVLAPAADQRLGFVLRGDGVQIYDCLFTGGNYVWTFRAPEADLLDEGNTVVGTHFVGPTWMADDGSFVQAARVAGAPAPLAGAVPWLLLAANAHGGPDGRMTGVTSIQRLSTVGGVAPDATTCNAVTVNTVARVPYTADYFFYRTNSGNGDGTRCGAP